VNESSDTGQASIVFLGRESFRMQVVGMDAGGTSVGAIPTAIWEGPTARIIERRNFDRRTGRRIGLVGEPQAMAQETATARVPARNMLIGISLLTFACGVAVATAANRLPRSASDRIAQIERRQPPTQPPALAPTATTAPAAMIIQPLAQPPEAPAAPEPAPTPELTRALVSSPFADPRTSKQPAQAKAAGAPRAVAARVARPRPTPAGAGRATDLDADDPFPAPPSRTPAPRKWVDPFAE
jgi:hypothetical protein